MSTEITLITKQNLVTAEKVDSIISEVLNSSEKGIFVQTAIRASAVVAIEELLTADYMAPIMKLQGKAIGFKTDLDKEPSPYRMEIVRQCLMEAMFVGIHPIGNQFNIIAGRMYPTKEGFSHLLKNIRGLWFDIVQQVPTYTDKHAIVETTIKWSIDNGEKKERFITLPVKVNDKMGSDAILGKAERKAKKWLYTQITGVNLPDGDIGDVELKPTNPKPKAPVDTTKNDQHEDAEVIDDEEEEQETPKVKSELQQRAEGYLRGAKNLEDLEKFYKIAQKNCPELDSEVYDELKAKFTQS